MRTFRPFEASPDQNTIGMLSIGKANNLIAISDIQMPPTVYIHNLNDFGLVSKLTGTLLIAKINVFFKHSSGRFVDKSHGVSKNLILFSK